MGCFQSSMSSFADASLSAGREVGSLFVEGASGRAATAAQETASCRRSDHSDPRSQFVTFMDGGK